MPSCGITRVGVFRLRFSVNRLPAIFENAIFCKAKPLLVASSFYAHSSYSLRPSARLFVSLILRSSTERCQASFGEQTCPDSLSLRGSHAHPKRKAQSMTVFQQGASSFVKACLEQSRDFQQESGSSRVRPVRLTRLSCLRRGPWLRPRHLSGPRQKHSATSRNDLRNPDEIFLRKSSAPTPR